MLRLLPLALLVPFAATAAQSRRAVVEIDHATGAARLIVRDGGRADTTALGKSPTVRLDRRTPVEVRVVNTNTAVYQLSQESARTPLPESESLRAFMGRAEPYLPELRGALRRGRGRGASAAQTAEEREAALTEAIGAASEALAHVEQSLVTIDDALYGRGGLQELTTTSLLALEQMRRGAAPEQASAPLRQAVGLGAACGAQDPVRLANAEKLLGGLTSLVQGAQALRATVDGAPFAGEARWRPVADSARTITQRAQGALSDFEPLVGGAYRIERLVGIVANACSSWSAGEFRGTHDAGRTVTVQVAPRPEAELARIADREAVTYTVAIQPQPLVRPMLSVAAIAAPGARFTKYGTRAVAGGSEVVESGRKDARFGVGATLGLTWPGLDQRAGRGFAVWLPEVAVGTGGGMHAFGVGPALSWGFLKVGAGAMWIRHAGLDGVRPGDVLGDGTTLPTSDVYGRPELYVTLSIIDLASPFDRK